MGNCYLKPVNNILSTTNNQTPTTPSPGIEKKKEWRVEEGGGGKESRKNGGYDIGERWISSEAKALTLKCFTYSELRCATRNFRPDSILREGGFGTVFKGWLQDANHTYATYAVAVKKSKTDTHQGHKEWQAEVKFLGKFSHPNLVKLIGYCWEDREYLLVYEYMQNGSLENHLFKKRSEPLPWCTRMKIATGAAQGLAFLHTTEKTVIYRDFKCANILLDGDFNAKLSDFGFAKFGPGNDASHVSTRIVGTCGYAAPEYIATGHLYVKSDVYSFGVALLEIITGLRVIDTNRPGSQHNLVDLARPALPDKRKLRRIIDPRLKDNYPSKGAHKAAELILRCLEQVPTNRPSMEEVVVSLQEINALKTKPKETNVATTQTKGPSYVHRYRYQSA